MPAEMAARGAALAGAAGDNSAPRRMALPCMRACRRVNKTCSRSLDPMSAYTCVWARDQEGAGRRADVPAALTIVL